MYKTIIDGLIFVAALIFVLGIMKQLGIVDLTPGSMQVVDGDSLRNGDTDIRLYGIDAPEYRQSCRDKHSAEYPCGKFSANALRSLVGRREVSCQPVETDYAGRMKTRILTFTLCLLASAAVMPLQARMKIYGLRRRKNR